ncbi:hypothetical protein [Streptomyces niveus]|uniref:hypothetical protein n=1 Tax=Streptomyces niveus TaxID=193462 RepID=UPI0036536487
MAMPPDHPLARRELVPFAELLLPAGDVVIYRRLDVVFRPPSGLPKAELVVAWRSRGPP